MCQENQSVAAFAVASLLAALLTLLIKSLVAWQFERDPQAAAGLPPHPSPSPVGAGGGFSAASPTGPIQSTDDQPLVSRFCGTCTLNEIYEH